MELILILIVISLAIVLWAIRRDTQLYARARRRKAGRMRKLRRQARRDETVC